MCTAVEKGVIYRRNDPGTTREEWCNWPDMPFEEMDNTLNVQQYIQQCIHKDPSDVDTILKVPPGQEEGVWKYEHVRQFCMQLNGLTLLLQCSAIDYTRHTLDGAAALLNSNKYFPSRISIKESSIAKIGSVCRRIYRIFSHAYFHHPELFENFETETHLCRRFTVFVKKYNLMANEHLIVPILEQKLNHP
ncbi:mps one binder kinase activator-like 4, variant [Loa loa]|uniref:Mps one binder kinase activator-like 4, variant n=1 Tax=Loa loa TaxID=7209 RepID=A0A1S0UJG8_LOALO|nr:mps one binder kinase activator-like 4, variant [Loa loa]EJD75576.1 mps one binder kinase activator-like 4, variant [Loa loa]